MAAQRSQESLDVQESLNDYGPHDASDLVERGQAHKNRVKFRGRVVHFTWAWFDLTMSTGALATLLGQQPHKFTGLMTIGKVVFIFDIVLFLAMCTFIAIRFKMRPSKCFLSARVLNPRLSNIQGPLRRVCIIRWRVSTSAPSGSLSR